MNKSKKLHMFYIFPVLYVASLYLFPFFASLSEELPLISYLTYTPLIFGILNIIMAVTFCKPQYRQIMLNSAVLVKYSLIPFFFIGGIMVVLCLFFTIIPVPFMFFLGPLSAGILCFAGWIVVALGSPYTISYLRLSQKDGIRSTLMAVIHSLLQFFFVLDVFDVMYLTLKERKWKKLTLAILILTIIGIVIFIIYFVSVLIRALL